MASSIADSPDAQPAPVVSFLDKATKAFRLHHPVPSTPARWRAYAGNRAAADKIRLRDRKAEKPGYESPESDGDEWDVFNDSIYLLRSIRRTMRELEGELQLPAQSLQKGCKVLWCNAAFEESYNPRTVDAMARLYSPCTPTYIDVHLQYHSRMRYYEVEWHISVGYKIHTRIPNTPANTVPADLDLKKLKEDVDGGLSNMHTTNGWCSILWGTWDRMGGSNFGPRFKRVETRGCDLYPDGVLDLHEALFGPLPDLQPDDKEGQVKRQEELVRTVRVVLAAVGMDYEISTKDDIPDKSPGEWESMDDKKLGHISWMTHGNTDKWFAREARQACGFQLPRDAKEKEEAEKEKKEIMEEEPEEGYSDDEFGPPGPGDCNHQ